MFVSLRAVFPYLSDETVTTRQPPSNDQVGVLDLPRLWKKIKPTNFWTPGKSPHEDSLGVVFMFADPKVSPHRNHWRYLE
jgi:hypothetical protein